MRNIYKSIFLFFGSLIFFFSNFQCIPIAERKAEVKKGSRIVLIGNNLASRMTEFGSFETEMHLRYPDSLLYIRNMGNPGNTPGFRPHASRNSPWAFPGAEAFQSELAIPSGSEGHFPSEDEWLEMLKPDIILAFFGYNESFGGEAGLANYKAELDAFIKHTLQQKYNGTAVPKLILVSPIAFEDLSDRYDLPNGEKENMNIELYAKAMEEVAQANQVAFVDAFTPTEKWFKSSKALTIDGSQLSAEGYERFSNFLVDDIFGEPSRRELRGRAREALHAAVMEKNWMWLNDFKIPNGVHVYGRRYNPFGPDNYPAEIEKIREMTAIRDRAIWKAAKGEKMDLVCCRCKNV